MTICWDRIGVTSPDQRKHLENGGHQSGNRNGGPGNSSSAPAAHNFFTPGKCVPVLVFVVERVPITAPWFEADASEAQIMDVSSASACCFCPGMRTLFTYSIWLSVDIAIATSTEEVYRRGSDTTAIRLQGVPSTPEHRFSRQCL